MIEGCLSMYMQVFMISVQNYNYIEQFDQELLVSTYTFIS